MANHCPFCGNYAYSVSVGASYRLDCRYCDIQIEITKRAYLARCPNPVAVLDYIREKMKSSTRPWIDLADMKRSAPIPANEVQMTARNDTARKDSEVPGNDQDMLTTAAKAIGSALGKIAVKTGIANAPAEPPAKPRRKAPAKKVAAVTKRKSAVKKPTRKAAPARKGR